nr:AMP-binding protein [Dactylosporangium thailandense]
MPSGEALACTIVDLLSETAQRSPDTVAYRFLGDGEAETSALTWGELDRQVRSVSAYTTRHCARGDRVVLLVPPRLAFLPAFLGVLHAGCVAVPVAPPGAAAAHLTALRRIIADAGAALVLHDVPGDGDDLTGSGAVVRPLGEALGCEPADGAPAADVRDLAFLQYTSGSTGDPKGVMVTHANLMANEAQIAGVFGTTPADVVVSWLPFYHDMGLIGAVLHPLYAGATAVLMPPTAFLRRPLRWLGAISRYGGTISPAPDFAYHLCAQIAAANGVPDGLDLRSWRVACDGSEPVRPATVRRFSEVFAGSGFDGAAFAPSYGMAEATLLVSGVAPGRAPRIVPFDRGDGHPTEVVSCGPWSVDEVLVVRDGVPAGDGVEGEVLVRGPNVAAGYWRRPEQTGATFGCRVGEHTYLRTGDLGFVRDGELFVTGRATDLIIVRGRNHHPNDIETTAQTADPSLPAGVGAVFTDGDDLVLVQAVRGDADPGRLTDTIRAAVSEAHGVHLDHVVLVPPRAVPRTTSGKVRRSECRRRYLAGELPVLTVAAGAAPGDGAATGPVDPRIGEAIAAVLGVEPASVRPGTPLTALGLDSLRALRVQDELATRTGAEVPLSVLLGGATPASLAGELARYTGGADGTGEQDQPGPDGDGEQDQPGPDGDGGMTVGQRALAFLSAVDARGAADYTIARSVRLPEDLEPAVFARAVSAVVARHPALRSRFAGEPGEQTLTVREPGEAAWCTVHELAAPDELEARTRRLLGTPLDLAADPLFGCTVLTAPGVAPVLVLRVSHLVADLHSIARVMDEILRVCRGEALPPPPAAFAGVVAEEAAYLRAPGTAALAERLAAGLRDLPDVRWPVPAPRGGTDAPGAAVTMRLDAPATAGLHALAQAERTTLFAVLLGLYGLFLTGLTGNDTIAVGVPFAAREGSRRRGAVGYLVNTLPIRLHLPPGTTPAAAVRAARQALFDGMDAARVPLAVVARHLRRSRTAAAALFPALFDLLDDPEPGVTGLGAAGLDLPGAVVTAGAQRFTPYLAGTPRPLADLDVAFTAAGDELRGRFAYDGRVFDDATGALLAELFTSLVRHAATAPHAPLAWHGGPPGALAAPPMSVLPAPDGDEPPRALGALFAEQAALRPDAEAVARAGERWTYARLAAQAAAAAAVLPAVRASAAVGTPLVGLCFADPVRFLTGMLAAWSKGYGIVPLPADFPDERLAYMMDDCDLGAVLADEHDGHAERLARLAGPARPVVSLPVVTLPVVTRPGADAPEPAGDGGPVLDAGDVVYVVYTSGTTGRPKGVPITSAQVLPLLRWQVKGLGAGPGMRLAQTLALSFDFGLQELMTTVLFGGTLCVPEPVERYAPDAFGAFLRRDRVETLFATPSFLRELVAHGVSLAGLRLLVLGGEMLTAAAVRDVLPLLGPGTGIINGYGPTEASINCTMHFVDRARITGADGGPPADGALPVGAATGRSDVYVLDERGRLLPAGLVGEVYIGGPGVAAGYLNRPGETEARFLPDPVAGSGVMYRTGDVGLVTGGELLLLGRLDHQVKIRGYRIELGEVEAVLRDCPGAEDAVALLDRGAEPARIVGVVVGTACDPAAARAELARRLPAYMVPGRIIRVAALPRTAHGKLDEDALLRRSREERAVTGHGGVRSAVAGAWQEQLGLDRVDPDANFFELGGHSLAVVPMLAAVSERVGVGKLPLHTLFEHPTVRLLAEHVEQLLARQAGAPAAAPGSSGGDGTDAAPPARPVARRQARGRQRGLADRSARPQGVSE